MSKKNKQQYSSLAKKLLEQAKNVESSEDSVEETSRVTQVELVDDDEDMEEEDEESIEDLEVEDEEGRVVPATEVLSDVIRETEDQDMTLGGAFLAKVATFNASLVERLIADMMFTDLSEVADHLRNWYIKEDKATFNSYASAEDAVFQLLINEFTQFDSERDFAHAVARWFANSLGLRK
jgi:hypothetical protein